MVNEEFDSKQNIEDEFDIFRVDFKTFVENHIAGIPNFLKRGGGMFFVNAFLRIIMCVRQIVNILKELRDGQAALQAKLDSLASQETCDDAEPTSEIPNTLDDMSFHELKSLAKEKGINTYKMKKADIKAVLNNISNG